MCFHPIKIVNKSDRIAANGGKPILYVPCGQCDECLEAKKKQYYVRTFAEYQDIQPFVESGQGMVYFDTLTYSNNFLPRWHGIEVFNHRHIQLFLKRLRKSLESAGFDSKNNLRYFICSEYGDNTQRPHYHVLFFIRFKIDVLDFWQFVRDSWQYGLTDRKFQKVVRGKVCKGARERVVDGNGALRYVSGYVVKDKSFMKIFDQKVAELVASGYVVDDSILRSLKPRFFLSRGFGLSFLEDQSAKYHFKMDYYEKTGRVTISDFKYIKQDFALPEYYRRKIFFQLEKKRLPGVIYDESNKESKDLYRLSWVPNQTYIDYCARNFKNIIDVAALNLYNSYLGLSDKYDGLLGKSMRVYVSERLGKRTFENLAFYQQFYCNRVSYSRVFLDCSHHWVHDTFFGKTIGLDHSSRYNESERIAEISPWIITDRCSPAFEYFDEILFILDKHALKRRKDTMAFVMAQRAQRRKTKYRSSNFY